MADEGDAWSEEGEGSKSLEPISVLEKLLDESLSNEKRFLDTKQRVREVIDVNTQDAGHTYVFTGNEGSVNIHISDKLVNRMVDINGKIPPETSFINLLALLRGTCDFNFGDAVIPTNELGMYGISSEKIMQKHNAELRKKRNIDKVKQLRDRAYNVVLGLEKHNYRSLRDVLKREGLLRREYMGLKKDPLVKELMTFFAGISQINEIAKENQTEYTEAGIKRLQQNILDVIGNRVGYQHYSEGGHYVDLPNIVLSYDIVDGGIKLNRSQLGKGQYLHTVNEISKLTEEEKKLLSIVKAVEVHDSWGGMGGSNSIRCYLKMGETTELDYHLDTFGELGVAERETARNLMDKLFPNFAYTKMEALPSRYGNGMGGNCEVS